MKATFTPRYDGCKARLSTALAPLGIRDAAMPATPERLWRAIRGARDRA